MEIRSIEEKAYSTMMIAFKQFATEMKELCGIAEREKRWLDNNEVRKLLHIETRTLQYYRDSGRLPYSMIGCKCYYKPADVQRLIDNSHIK